MRSKHFIHALPVALVLAIGACSGSGKNEKPNSAALIADSLFTEKFDVRRFNLGMLREEFDMGDDSTVLENEKDLVVESISLQHADSVFAECSYHFERDMFQSAEINVFSPTESLNKQVADTLVKRLNRRYGQGVEARGFNSWKAKSKKGYQLEIIMGDVSYELGSPVTQVQIHADLVEKPMMAHLTRNKYPQTVNRKD
ncbi:MAG TPA: hypothetical protein VD905_17515 [Flavobacteriales bacterium]|nr:hypothetical protein [Flavobacteriales bacterium]